MSYPVPVIGTNSVPPSSAIAQLATDTSFLLNGHATVSSAAATSLLGLTTTITDIAGCSISCTITGTNGVAFVLGIFDMSKTAAGASCVGYCNLDGADQTEQAILGDGSALADRATVGQVWRLSLTVGAHTIKLRANKSANVGTMNANSPHTKIVALIIDNQ
jgi:hypothetical protein